MHTHVGLYAISKRVAKDVKTIQNKQNESKWLTRAVWAGVVEKRKEKRKQKKGAADDPTRPRARHNRHQRVVLVIGVISNHALDTRVVQPQTPPRVTQRRAPRPRVVPHVSFVHSLERL